MQVISKTVASVLSIIALVASGLVGASVANAAPGDVTEIGLAAGATPRGVAPGPDGSIWVTGGASKTVAKVTMTGAVTAYALPLPANVGNPWGIAAGPDGNMWFTLRDGGKIGRITMQGAVSVIDLPDSTMRPQGIAAGSDGNMWFTELGGRIGRVTMAGAVTMFTVPWANSQPHSIVQGPTGSSRMYFTDAGADRIAYVLVDGTTYGSVQLATASDPTGITNVDGAIWFAMSARNQLGKLVADTTVLEMSVPGAPTGLANGVGNTMWVSLTARNSVAKYSAQ
ncbi:MAG: virginiamycin B lyase family protein [Candidatus Nanopelagicales bacterium]